MVVNVFHLVPKPAVLNTKNVILKRLWLEPDLELKASSAKEGVENLHSVRMTHICACLFTHTLMQSCAYLNHICVIKMFHRKCLQRFRASQLLLTAQLRERRNSDTGTLHRYVTNIFSLLGPQAAEESQEEQGGSRGGCV